MLLDGVILLVNTKKGNVNSNIISDLKERLTILLKEWICLNYSTTPKMHCLLNHSISQLKYTDGFSDLGEGILKWAHQVWIRHDDRLLRFRNKDKKMLSQANFLDIAHIKEVKEIQTDVSASWKRDLRCTVPLKEEIFLKAKKLKQEEMETVWDIKSKETDVSSVLKPREYIKEKMK